MNIIGISEGFHDAAMCVIRGRKILHASQSERFSGVKNDCWIHPSQWPTSEQNQPDVVAYYEKPFRKNLRRLWAGQSWETPRVKYDYSFSHHESHAAAGYYTSPFNECNILVIDAIGEWDTLSIWKAKNSKMKRIRSGNYPYSLGLL
jgi:carbamoyltransferase